MGSAREEIAKNICFYRKKAGLTQKQLAEAIGAKKSSISNWELAQNSPDIDTLVEICKILNVTARDMFGIYAGADAPALSAHEREMVDAYRAHPEMQAAVDKLLGVEPEERADESAELVEAFVSAAAKKSTPSG